MPPANAASNSNSSALLLFRWARQAVGFGEAGDGRGTRRTRWWSDGYDDSATAVVRIVAALGGNALLERGERPDAEVQERHVSQAVAALAPLAREHQLVITHGNGPQVGMLALESAQDPALS